VFPFQESTARVLRTAATITSRRAIQRSGRDNRRALGTPATTGGRCNQARIRCRNEANAGRYGRTINPSSRLLTNAPVPSPLHSECLDEQPSDFGGRPERAPRRAKKQASSAHRNTSGARENLPRLGRCRISEPHGTLVKAAARLR
jgi:hypothetical protein